MPEHRFARIGLLPAERFELRWNTAGRLQSALQLERDPGL
jgi:hypothetical protein